MFAMIFTTAAIVLLLFAISLLTLMASGLWRLDHTACRYAVDGEVGEGKGHA
jgi:hypothetical protein